MSQIVLNIQDSYINYLNKPINDSKQLHFSNLESARQFAFQITNTFEGGKTDSLQTQDSGIISYGKHQATLKSGALELVLNEYISRSNNPIAFKLISYIKRVKDKDSALRHDHDFINLLKAAAKDQIMEESQERVFIKRYWLPAVKIANDRGIRSDIGLAIFYDTKVQGGLLNIVARVENRLSRILPNKLIDEHSYLKIFLEERREYLNQIARQRILQGDNSSARILFSSAENRISMLSRLLE